MLVMGENKGLACYSPPRLSPVFFHNHYSVLSSKLLHPNQIAKKEYQVYHDHYKMGGIHAGVLHLARRGLEASVSIADKGDHDGSHDGERPQFKIPVGGSLLMAFTLFCFIILIVSVRHHSTKPAPAKLR